MIGAGVAPSEPSSRGRIADPYAEIPSLPYRPKTLTDTLSGLSYCQLTQNVVRSPHSVRARAPPPWLIQGRPCLRCKEPPTQRHASGRGVFADQSGTPNSLRMSFIFMTRRLRALSRVLIG